MKKLGEEWSIHAVGRAKDVNRQLTLVKDGPYKYIRHPIYLATILELFGITILFNTFYSLIFVMLGSPVYALRAFFEEKKLVEIFGGEYLLYRQEVPFIIPFFNILKRK